jgi:hypothetical protein
MDVKVFVANCLLDFDDNESDDRAEAGREDKRDFKS